MAGLRDWSCGLVEESVDSFHRARHASSRVFQFQWPDAATSNATGLVKRLGGPYTYVRLD